MGDGMMMKNVRILVAAAACVLLGMPLLAEEPQRVGRLHRLAFDDGQQRVLSTIDVAIPKLRTGTYFPEWLLQRRRRPGRYNRGPAPGARPIRRRLAPGSRPPPAAPAAPPADRDKQHDTVSARAAPCS